jgi:hypothetical protein
MVFILYCIDALAMMDRAEGLVFVNGWILVATLGVHGEPAFLDALLL